MIKCSCLKNFFANFGRNFKEKREQKKREKEQERREEIKRLEEKQQENRIFISDIKVKLNDLQKIFKELEETEKRSFVLFGEFEENTKQIDLLNEKPGKFIFRLFNQSKIKKLNILCGKQKQEMAKVEKTLNDKKEEMRNLADVLLKSFSSSF